MKNFLILIFILFSVKAIAQDIVFTQSFIVPETLNSSFTGAIRSSKMGSIYRSQWRDAGLKTNANFVYFDTWFEVFKTGLGISFLNQTESGSNYTFNQVNFNYSMAFQLNDSWFFRPSISVGYGIKSYGFQNLLLEDQINLNSGGVNPSTLDPFLLREKRNFFDFSSSILFNNEDSWIGLTLRHLNKPNISLSEVGNTPLDIFLSAHAKYLIPAFNNSRNDFYGMSKIYFLANYMKQGSFNRLDVGSQYIFDDQFSLGILLATSPFNDIENTSTISSINTFASVKWNGFRFGYSYDSNTTKLRTTGGIHEFSISYDFNVNLRALSRSKCISYF